MKLPSHTGLIKQTSRSPEKRFLTRLTAKRLSTLFVFASISAGFVHAADSGETGKLTNKEQVYELALRAAGPNSQQSVTEVMRSWARHGDFENALTIADSLEDSLRREAFTAIADALIGMDRLDDALPIVMRLGKSRDDLLERMALAEARNGNAARVHELVGLFEYSHRADKILSQAAILFAKDRKLEDAAQLVRRINGIGVPVLRSDALAAMAGTGPLGLNLAESIAEDTKRAEQKTRELVAIAIAVAARDDRQAAAAVAERAKTAASKISDELNRIQSMASVAIAMADAGLVLRARQLLTEEENLLKALKLDTLTFNLGDTLTALATAWAFLGDADQAFATARRIPYNDEHPLVRAHDRNKALGYVVLSLLDVHERYHWSFGYSYLDETIAAALQSRTRIGTVEQAVRITHDVDGQSRFTRLEAIAWNLLERDNVVGAIETLGGITSDNWRESVFLGVMVELSVNDDLSRAIEFNLAIPEASFAESVLLKSVEELRKIDRIADAAKLAGARFQVENYSEINPRFDDVYLVTAVAEAERAAFDHAKEVAGRISNSATRGVALAGIARAHFERGDKQASEDTLKHAENAIGVAESSFGRNDSALAEIAATLMLIGDNRRARTIAQRIDNDDQRADVLSKVASAHARRGDVDAALRVANTIEVPEARVRAMVAIAETSARVDPGSLAKGESSTMKLFIEKLDWPNTIDARYEATIALAALGSRAEGAERALRKLLKEEQRNGIRSAVTSTGGITNDQAIRLRLLSHYALQSIGVSDVPPIKQVFSSFSEEVVVNALVGMLTSSEQLVIDLASAELLRIGEPAIPALTSALAPPPRRFYGPTGHLKERQRRARMARAGDVIVRIGEAAIPYLVSSMGSDVWEVVSGASRNLTKLGWKPASVEEQVLFLAGKAELEEASSLGPEAVPMLIAVVRKAMNGKWGSVDQSGVEALGEIGDPRAKAVLIEAVTSDDEYLSAIAIEALAPLGGEAVVDLLVRQLERSASQVRAAAVKALGSLRDAKAAPAILGMRQDKEVLVRMEVASALGSFPPSSAVADFLVELMYDDDDFVRSIAIGSLVEIGPASPRVVPALVEELNLKSPVRASATYTLGFMGDAADPGVPLLIAMLHDESDPHRRYAAISLCRLGREVDTSIPLLIETLDKGRVQLQLRAIHALGDLGPQAADVLPRLRMLQSHSDELIEQAAIDAIHKISDQDG